MRVLIALLLALVMSPIWAGALPDEPHIAVSGSYQVKAVPDRLRMSLSLSEVGRDVAFAQAEVDRRASRLIETLKRLGVGKADIASSQLQVTPHYNWNNREQVYVGSEVSRTVEIILRDITKYDALLRAVIDAKVGRINSTQLESSQMKQLRAQALQGAILDARNKAELLVADLNVRLGEVYSINAQGGGAVPMMASYRLQAESAESAFEPGTLEFTETVGVVFYLLSSTVVLSE